MSEKLVLEWFSKYFLMCVQRLLPLMSTGAPIPIPVIKKGEILSLGKCHNDFIGVFYKSPLPYLFGPHPYRPNFETSAFIKFRGRKSTKCEAHPWKSLLTEESLGKFLRN